MNSPYLQIPAAAYVRCSTDGQGGPEGSIDQQKQEILNWAKKNNFRVDVWYIDEGKSGTTFERPGFLKLISDIEIGASFKSVIAWDESRWGRAKDPRENSYWKIHFKRFGVQVKIINSNSQNGDDVGSYVIEAVESAESSEYSKKLSRSTFRGQKANALAGYSNGGSAPYGLKRVAVNKITGEFNRELPPGVRSYPDEKVLFELGEPHEVDTVKRIFDLKLQGLGYKKIASILNAEGIPCPKTGKWRNKNQMWSACTLLTICSNPAYAGIRVFNRHPQSHISGVTKEKWINDPCDWIIKEGAHPIIISPKKFEQLNKLRKPYQRSNRFFSESPYLLSGILKCKSCGFNFQGQTRRLKSAKGEEYKIHYYLDGGYAGKGNSVCKSYLLRREVLEGFIINQIKIFISDEYFLNKVYQTIEKKLYNTSEIDSILSNYSKQLDDNNKILKKLLELIRNGVSLRQVQDEIYRINKENEFLQKNYDELKNKHIGKKDIKNLIENIKELVNNFENTFSNAQLHIQKNIIRQFISEIIVDPSENIICCNFRKVPWVENLNSEKYIYGFEEIRININGRIKACRRTA